MNSNEQYPNTYDGLLQILARLRGPDGCPWDCEQTRDSLKRQFLEECYELIEAIDEGDVQKLAEELGDVLLHVGLQIQIGEEEGEFTSERVFKLLIEKLVRRHPHIFGDDKAADAREVEANWEIIKRREKAGKESPESSALDGVPRQMPALGYAQAVQVRAARIGFDWNDLGGVLDKVAEEVGELERAQSEAEKEHELGDLLFSIVNSARWMGMDAEGALRKANAQFYRRFALMERLSRERGLNFSRLSMDEKEPLWQEAKGLQS